MNGCNGGGENDYEQVARVGNNVFRLALPTASGFLRGIGKGESQQFWRLDAQAGGEHWNFIVRHATQLSLYLGQRSPAQIPTENIELGHKLMLREPFLFAQLANDWADNVLVSGHCSKIRA
jgi:hypothetical protein